MAISSKRTASIIDKDTDAVLGITPGIRWHQIDAGTATAGTLSVIIDFGSGARTLEEIDFTDTAREPILIFGDIKSITLSPSGVDVDYSVVYISEKGV